MADMTTRDELVAHTPGPWSAHGLTVMARGVKDLVVVCDGDHSRGTYEEGCANSRLIAAAPDLLGIVSEMLQSAKDGTWNTDREWFVTKARALLAEYSITKREG